MLTPNPHPAHQSHIELTAERENDEGNKSALLRQYFLNSVQHARSCSESGPAVLRLSCFHEGHERKSVCTTMYSSVVHPNPEELLSAQEEFSYFSEQKRFHDCAVPDD